MHLSSLARVMPLAAFLAGTLPAWGVEIDARSFVRRAPTVIGLKTEVFSTCRATYTCGRYGCRWEHVCPRRCPDRYSCSSLYGAYGPYGGAAYWGRYTWRSWGPYR